MAAHLRDRNKVSLPERPKDETLAQHRSKDVETASTAFLRITSERLHTMSKDHLQLTAVTPCAPFTLHLTYADGEAFEVDLQDWIAATQALKP